MSTATLVSVEEYLATSWRPDRELVEGVLVERNVGQKDHSNLQTELAVWFRNRRLQLSLTALVEMRIRVSATRFRIPDVCVVDLPIPDEQVFIRPPLICAEVISPDDSLRGM
ncbi:MAG TPA: Uma2 family endonuclease, partial [Bryobacteraceae bacterium]|nr:Uma2 family endonuclease [Bryobacteraceae bacterium]